MLIDHCTTINAYVETIRLAKYNVKQEDMLSNYGPGRKCSISLYLCQKNVSNCSKTIGGEKRNCTSKN